MFEITFEALKAHEGETKVVYFTKFDKPNFKGVEDFLNKEETGILKKAIESSEFLGEENTFAQTYTPKGKIIACGLGEKVTELALQKLGGLLFKRLFMDRDKNVVVLVRDIKDLELNHASIAFNIALGMELGGYSFDKYFTTKKPREFPALEKVNFKSFEQRIDKKGYNDYRAVSNAVRYARDLVNEPSNQLTPAVYAADIKRLEYLGLKVEILDRKAIAKLKMGLLLGVAQGSVNEPKVAILRWQGNKKKKDFELCLVGKGVTFDSGGINLKPSNAMEGMQADMAGSAAVVASMKAIAMQKLPQNILGIVGLVENMPSGTALKPGDVLTAMSGKTVEIGNTDAEGRLVLADIMWYAQDKLKVKKMLDIATLTGATSYIFAGKYASILGNDDKLIKEVTDLGLKVGEKFWHMPMDKEYDKMIKSIVADVNNAGKSGAGTSTAASFLKHFVKDDVKWAHLDIAGCDTAKEPAELFPKGATGFGVRTFVELAKGLAKAKMVGSD